MIETMRFTNVDGRYVDLNDDYLPLRDWNTEISVRMTEREKAQQHGLYPSNTYFGKRLWHFEGDAFGDTAAELIARRNQFMSCFVPKNHLGYSEIGVLETLFTGMGEVLSSVCTVESWPEFPLKGASPGRSVYQLNLKSFDPRVYGVTQSIELPYGMQENLGGRTYDKTYNKTYSTSGLSGLDVSIVNNGTIETFPVITFYGPAISPRVILFRGDGEVCYMTLSGITLATSADWVKVDMLRRTAVDVNGTNYYHSTIGSDWFALEPTPTINLMRYLPASASAPSKAVVEWRNAYVL